jgi:hypothetical protein
MNNLSRFTLASMLSICFAALFPSGGQAGQLNELRAGEKYEIVGTLYAHGVAHDLDKRTVSIVVLEKLRLSGPEVVWRRVVPVGSTLTIVERAPKKLFIFFAAPRYIVRISGIEMPPDVPIVIDLSRGVEGSMTPLNPQIFKPL